MLSAEVVEGLLSALDAWGWDVQTQQWSCWLGTAEMSPEFGTCWDGAPGYQV